METLTIDCDDCVLLGTEACTGCLVSVLCGPPGDHTGFDADEAHVVGLLGGCGLVPPLRHVRRHANVRAESVPGRPKGG